MGGRPRHMRGALALAALAALAAGGGAARVGRARAAARPRAAPAACASPPPRHVRAFTAAVADALADPRRVDELVCQFAYWGQLSMPEREPAVGHGAIKRRLHELLGTEVGRAAARFGDASRRGGADAAAAEAEEWAMALRLEWAEAAAPLELALTLRFAPPAGPGGARALDELRAAPTAGAAPVGGAAAAAAAAASMASAAADAATLGGRDAPGVQPRWQTFDGRTTQRIWQARGLFDARAGEGLLARALPLSTGRVVAVVDDTVWALYGPAVQGWAARQGVRVEPIVLAGNEDQKTMPNVLHLLDELARVDPLRRSEPVLAIGGGVLTDMAGFACALWRRGIPWCRMPTTLLGMVDASVGIKVATNYIRKNGVGAFHSPLHTFVDASFLSTLPRADVLSGVGEMMKAALVHDAALFELLEAHGPALVDSKFDDGSAAADEAIRRSVDAMLTCIGPDLWEESLVRPMDFGHSLSRTLEASEAFKLRHGEAVAIDCAFSTLLAQQLGLLSRADAQRVLAAYEALGLPCSVRGVSAATYKRAVREITVHRDGLLRAPLPGPIGACVFVDAIEDAHVDAAFAELEAFVDAHPHTLWDRSRSFDAQHPARPPQPPREREDVPSAA